MKHGIKNAIIEATKLEDEGRGLMAWITLIYDYGGGQGFGGHTLYSDTDDIGGWYIQRVLDTVGVARWSDLPRKAIRADIRDGLIYGIGHIIGDKWFLPRVEIPARIAAMELARAKEGKQ